MRVTRIRIGIGRLLACTFCGFLYFIGTAALSGADVIVDHVSNANASSSTHVSWSHTVGSGDDRLLVVGVAASYGQDPPGSFPATIKYGNQSLQLVGSPAPPGSRFSVYQVLAPTTGTHTITVTLSTSAFQITAGAISVTGVNPTTPTSGSIGRYYPDPHSQCGPKVSVPNGGMAIGAKFGTVSSLAWFPVFGSGSNMLDWGLFRADSQLGLASAESTASLNKVCPDPLNSEAAESLISLAILPKNFNSLSISGKIKKNDGSSVPDLEVGVYISLTNNPDIKGWAYPDTDTAGNYSFVNLPAHDNYILTLRSYYFTFDPPSPSPKDYYGGDTYPFIDLSTNVTANFTAIPRPTYSVSGRVSRDNTTPVSGVTVTAQVGGPMPEKRTVVTDAHGNYAFTNLPCSYAFTFTPTAAGYAFSPPSFEGGSLSPVNVTKDFTATLNTGSPAVQWMTQPNPKLNGKVGRLVVNFGKEVEYRFSGVEVFVPGGTTATRKQFGTERDIVLAPSHYDVAISGARVAQVPITVATDTRLLSGALRITASDKTRVEVWDAGRTKLLQWTIGNGAIGLPVGHYSIQVGKGTGAFNDVIIEDGKITDFHAP